MPYLISPASDVPIAQKALMIQRDGDVVDASTGQTTWQVEGIAAGQYYVSLRHRNHLDVMTASAVELKQVPTLIDFSLAATPVSGSHTRLETDTITLMYAGDANLDHRAIANGPNKDTTILISSVLVASENDSFSANYIRSDYDTGDLNMDGNTIFAGPDNDANLLLGNILLHSVNNTFSANYIINGSMTVKNRPTP